MDIFLTVVGALIGWLISHLYARKAGREQGAEMNALRQEIRKHTQYLMSVVPLVEVENPKLAREIREVVTSGKYPEAENVVVMKGDACPACGKPDLMFDCWGNGPLGPSNAWFACGSCSHRFQTAESPQD
jgi:hypothetical protein